MKFFYFLLIPAILLSEIITLNNKYYTTVYDTDKKVPLKITYTLDSKVKDTSAKDRPSFKADDRLKDSPKPSDYTNSGYDRGHVASDASFDFNKEALESVYLMSNIIPQLPEVNRNVWKKIEERERELAIKNTINVVNVIVPSSKSIKNNVNIPSEFTKAILENNKIVECYNVKNEIPKSENINDFKISNAECESKIK